MKAPTESIGEFRKRLNQRALDEDEDRPTTADSEGWFLGEQARNKGSIHCDVWTGTAADLAERGVIGVCPVSGWWKDQPKRDRSALGARYALVVSIEYSRRAHDAESIARFVAGLRHALQEMGRTSPEQFALPGVDASSMAIVADLLAELDEA